MAEQSLSQLTPIINDNDLKFIESNGKILFSTEEIGRQLGYRNPSKSVSPKQASESHTSARFSVSIPKSAQISLSHCNSKILYSCVLDALE